MSNPNEQALQPLNGQRQNGESDAAVTACNDWLRMGAGRSVPALLEQYQQKSAFISNFKPPSTSYKTLNTWSSRYNWSDRATEYDTTWEQRKNAEREAVLSRGLALEYERINRLYKLAELLEGQIYERNADSGVFHNLWVPDVKSIGSGEFAERVDIERFNAPLLEQYRKALDDIAKEVGGRVDNKNLSGSLQLQWVDPITDDDEIGIGADELPGPDETA